MRRKMKRKKQKKKQKKKLKKNQKNWPNPQNESPGLDLQARPAPMAQNHLQNQPGLPSRENQANPPRNLLPAFYYKEEIDNNKRYYKYYEIIMKKNVNILI